MTHTRKLHAQWTSYMLLNWDIPGTQLYCYAYPNPQKPTGTQMKLENQSIRGFFRVF